MVVKLYVEGGGDSERLHRRCREGFRVFLERAGLKGQMPRIVACGGRQAAYERFRVACDAHQETALLLIDSEEKVSGHSPWEHLRREGFFPPCHTNDDHCHLMVVCMESWLLADHETLSRFFGPGFNAGALPQRGNVERLSKKEVYESLRKASAHCKTKAPYDKGEHSFALLLQIDPEKVSSASPWGARFLHVLRNIAKKDGG
ncbi:MAG TPA: DUF4276 family protein [Synergistaceae bacterium]|nr:DUF4276 family protein [Synergistaceae bacterium]